MQTVKIVVLLTDEQPIFLFEGKSALQQFVYNANDADEQGLRLRRYATVWQRITPAYGNPLLSCGPSIRIRYADEFGNPDLDEREARIAKKVFQAQSDSKCFFGVTSHEIESPSYGLFGSHEGSDWVMDLATGRTIDIYDLRDVRQGILHYIAPEGERYFAPHRLYDYSTGCLIAASPIIQTS